MAKKSSPHVENMRRPGKGELGDLDHIEEYKHTNILPESKGKKGGKAEDQGVTGREHKQRKDADRKKRNKGRA